MLHARWLHGDPDSHGKITYQAGSSQELTGQLLEQKRGWQHLGDDRTSERTSATCNSPEMQRRGERETRLDYIKAELLAPGEISFTSDPQLGKAGSLRRVPEAAKTFQLSEAVITADSWDEMCDNAAEYFRTEPRSERNTETELVWKQAS